jgi:predicted ester cyclase
LRRCRERYNRPGIERVVDGKIVEHWEQFDAIGMMQQLGAIPSP